MRLLSRTMSAALVVAALVSGCSSSSNNNDGSSSSGLQPTTKLVDLTTAQRNQLCMEESANGTGAVSCPDAGATTVAPGVCPASAIQPDCSATVATSKTCAARLLADACNYQAYTADLATPECLVMLECTNSLCTNSFCFCSNNNSLTQCLSSCKNFTHGLTVDCATCAAGVFSATLTCPDFTKLPSPYVQCATTCAAHGG
jgi:hypothetical protein